MPKVSVVIPSYNHAPFIGHAVDSVLNQSETDLELIVIDDGSTDNSLEVLSSFSDPRFKVYTQSNQGAHAAINRGLQIACGEFLAILNSDDAYHPQRLEKTIAALDDDAQIGLVGSHIEIIDINNRTLGVKHGYLDCPPWSLEHPERSFRAGNDLHAALLTENYLATTSNFVFRRRWYEQVGEFRPLRYAHDWDFALRMARISRLALLPEPLVRYRVHESNTIRENQAAMIFEICWCLAVHLPIQADRTLFTEESRLEDHISQLLHSISVYDLDRVLGVMLLQKLHENTAQAVELLDPGSPSRKAYIRFIEERLEKAATGARKRAARSPSLPIRGWNKLKRLIKQRIPN